jgi:hypothetical protein
MSEGSDDEGFVEFLEERNVGGTTSDLPHLRSQCMTHKFTELNYINKCENCYCYVCDVTANICSDWTAHCEACNEGIKKDYWKKYKNDEMERRRIADGRPKKKLKTILSFFGKVEHPSNKIDPREPVLQDRLDLKAPDLQDLAKVDTAEHTAELKDQISP